MEKNQDTYYFDVEESEDCKGVWVRNQKTLTRNFLTWEDIVDMTNLRQALESGGPVVLVITPEVIH